MWQSELPEVDSVRNVYSFREPGMPFTTTESRQPVSMEVCKSGLKTVFAWDVVVVELIWARIFRIDTRDRWWVVVYLLRL